MAKTDTRINADYGVSPLQWLGVGVMGLFVLIPFYITVFGGFKTIGELRTRPFALPEHWDFTSFHAVMESGPFGQMMLNSLLISTLTVALTVLLASMAAFALVHIRFFGRDYLAAFFTVGLLFPVATAILPVFLLLRDIDLLNSAWGVILPQVAFGLAFAIMLFRTFFAELPKELIEAARMDRCGYLAIYWYVVLPLSLPIIATVGVFTFMTSWNSYLLPLVTLSSVDHYTWPLGIQQYQGAYSTDWPKLLALLTLTLAPAIVFFLFAQRYIIAGLTGGAVKG
ncbi:thiamine ABC transporter ATP-binding protein [Xaviernesmea oryzae]|uniref:Thiamine ABC transporter ATP-binding protein n=1 Tax=Xaviernesmea oryzae TaxID=464029 RepID=A0A1Q9AR91_9HYPH|nr:carbohydrate ABC transporter permease [Xaviernesmea oryzae]OLP57899.1 thiamine ABC transporter ATP-binding protein [Xaviernesmea oryzae]SEL31958.1 raffinose/stachyose/melibiose transport system permease protein [Xaviernesmea oryzae]